MWGQELFIFPQVDVVGAYIQLFLCYQMGLEPNDSQTVWRFSIKLVFHICLFLVSTWCYRNGNEALFWLYKAAPSGGSTWAWCRGSTDDGISTRWAHVWVIWLLFVQFENGLHSIGSCLGTSKWAGYLGDHLNNFQSGICRCIFCHN